MNRGLDAQNAALATQELRITQLQATATRNKPQKRRAVMPDPNDRFININNVIATRENIGAMLDIEGMSRAVQNLPYEAFCHEFQL